MIRKICSTPSPADGPVNTIHCGCAEARCGCPEAAETAARASPTTTTIMVSTRSPIVVRLRGRVAQRLTSRPWPWCRRPSRPHFNSSELARPSIWGALAWSALVSLAAMRRPRGLAQLACALVACVVAVGVIAAVIVTKDGDESAAPTTGRVGADHRHETQCPDHRRGNPRRPRSHGAPGRPQLDARSRCPARIGTRSRLRTSRTSVPSTRSSGIRRPGCASSSCSEALKATAPSRA